MKHPSKIYTPAPQGMALNTPPDPEDGARKVGASELKYGGALLTAEQVAQMLGVPKTWVYEQSRRNRIPTVTLGRYRRYRLEAITHWIEEIEAGEVLV